MKMTYNRQLILAILGDEIGESLPPHSATHIAYHLEAAINFKYDGIYERMKTLPNKQQIHRTLRDLLAAGLISGTKIKQEGNSYGNPLPQWVTYYELSTDVARNALINECNEIFNQVKKAKYGVNLFGVAIMHGLPKEELAPLLLRVRSLMQRTHPDKAEGYEQQFIKMKQCSSWIKDGIPLPTDKAPNNATII
jgi:hypothetical protein